MTDAELEQLFLDALTVEAREQVRELEDIANNEDPLSEDDTAEEWRKALMVVLRPVILSAYRQQAEELARLREALGAIASPGSIEDFGNGWAVGLARKALQ